MTKPCAVPKCKTGYKSVKQKTSVFKVPNNAEMRKKWMLAIPGRSHFNEVFYVCEHHFEKKFVKKQCVKNNVEGAVIFKRDYDRAQLQPGAPGAYPTIFNDVSETVDDCSMDEAPCAETSHATNDVVSEDLPLPKDQEHVHNVEQEGTSADNCSEVNMEFDVVDIEHPDVNEAQGCEPELLPGAEMETQPEPKILRIIEKISVGYSSEESVPIPWSWTASEAIVDNRHHVIFSHVVSRRRDSSAIPTLTKAVTIDKAGKIEYSVYGRKLEPSEGSGFPLQLENCKDVPAILLEFEKKRACEGVILSGDVNVQLSAIFESSDGVWHSKNCTLITNGRKCVACKDLLQRINRSERRAKNKRKLLRAKACSNPLDDKKRQHLQKQLRLERQRKLRAAKKVASLKEELEKKCDELRAMASESIETKLNECRNVSPLQRTAVMEIFSAAKRSKRGRRYSHEWLMLCMLLSIRSPACYDFLRENGILPLPCRRTIRGYCSSSDFTCGFDENFAKLLKKQFSSKTKLQRSGIIALDEINLRKSITVSAQSLTYEGLVDFGKDGLQGDNIEDQATHGLVFLFQSLGESYAQPFAVFASKNPVSGEDLAKLLIQAIVYIENCGGFIHGVVSDGASTNVKMRKLLGVNTSINGLTTSFQHPVSEDRRVFMFADVPHIIKLIRNRLFNNKRLRINESSPYIEWKFLSTLYELDTAHGGLARACPKLTKRHINVDSMSKMRVKLATQVFSNSVAAGMTFYLRQNPTEMKGCEETRDFCKLMNDIFDALNRKQPNEGLTPDGEDVKILRDALQWLNDWELAYINKEIPANEFLTTESAHSLRLSLQSTIDMCSYLIDKFDFKYLLSGKVNQDNLEKFFGTIRQAAGANEHPNCPTFLQLYKLLSKYSIIKPPKAGNCTIDNSTPPELLFTISDFKELCGNKVSRSTEKLKEMKRKIDDTLKQSDWEAEDIFKLTDHDYALSDTIDCIIYYVTGYLCKQLLQKYRSCTLCRSSLTQAPELPSPSQSYLTDVKSRGRLIHPNIHLFNLISFAETCFTKYCSLKNVFDLTVDDILEQYNFTFPCEEHGADVLSFALHYYIRMRMRQYSHQVNLSLKQKFVKQKKLSKLNNQ